MPQFEHARSCNADLELGFRRDFDEEAEEEWEWEEEVEGAIGDVVKVEEDWSTDWNA